MMKQRLLHCSSTGGAMLLLLGLLLARLGSGFGPVLVSSSSHSSSFVPPPTTISTTTYARFLSSPTSSILLHGSTQKSEIGVPITSSNTAIWTREQLDEFANLQGVVLSLSNLGPAYRAICRAKHNQTMILGYIEGFVRGNVLHLDKMEVYRVMVERARQQSSGKFKGGGTFLGVGLLLAFLCALHGQESGCRIGEFLAIDDADYQHKRLVRLYKLCGFQVIKYVGDDFRDIPDRMVWGGCGTLMRQEIPWLLDSWSRILDKGELLSSYKKQAT